MAGYINLLESIKLLKQEFKNKALSVNNIYYLQPIIKSDFLVALSEIKYNKIIKCQAQEIYRNKKTSLIDKKHPLFAFYCLSKYRQINIKEVKLDAKRKYHASHVMDCTLGVSNIKLDQ